VQEIGGDMTPPLTYLASSDDGSNAVPMKSQVINCWNLHVCAMGKANANSLDKNKICTPENGYIEGTKTKDLTFRVSFTQSPRIGAIANNS
jgi:hypothetical protein